MDSCNNINNIGNINSIGNGNNTSCNKISCTTTTNKRSDNDVNNNANNDINNDGTINWWNIQLDQNEADAVAETIHNRNISQGEKTALLEQKLAEMLNIPYVVCTISGTMALLMAYLALDVKPGDEIIIPDRTFIATAHAAVLLGAKIVLVETEKDLPLIDVSKIKSKITDKTKVIVPVHLNGRSAKMEEIKNIAKENGLFVVEDTAQALFSKNSSGFLGTQSDIGCFSLGVTKFITTGQGGFVVTKNKEIYDKLKLLRNHGVVNTLEDSYNQFGFNFKYNDILASIGLKQLNRIDDYINRLNKIYRIYEKAINGLDFLKIIPVDIENGEIPLWIEVLCNNREKLMRFLKLNNIETRQFLPDLHLSPHLQNNNYNDGDFSNSKFSQQGLYLPCGPNLSLDCIDKVISVLRKYK
tara:strand:- start:255 stop:1493 length:1239 start_codon:yes stop_codon:yes gene_type:complete